MSLITAALTKNQQGKITDPLSNYQPTEKTIFDKIAQVRAAFTLGDQTMRAPRREFNDYNILQRMGADQMAFNTYQQNDGDALEGDEMYAWKSRAVRPIVRSKCMSIAAHATARLIFPKIFALNKNSEEDRDAAIVMRDLIEYAAEDAKYPEIFLYSVIAAMVNPAAIVHEEYCEVYRTVKDEAEDGTITEKEILDDVLSGFKQTVVPCNELYIENFYENDIQKQGWLIWRKVISYSLAQAKYMKKYDDFKYVKPGVQALYDMANNTFYDVYDTNMTTEQVEEVVYWNRNLDEYLIVVNGVMLTKPNNPNPRKDKKFPFSKFGYALIDEGKCFYYKSLVFTMGPDARIINSIYPMIIDGTYLSIFPPVVVTGGEEIGSDVIIPGAVTTLADPDSKLSPLNVTGNLMNGLSTLMDVERSLNLASQDNQQSGVATKGEQTAFEVQRLEENAATVLGLFINMIGHGVKQIGELMKGDIIQFMTVADVDKLVDNKELVYKSFLLQERRAGGMTKTRKIQFTAGLPEGEMDPDDLENMSLDILELQGGINSKLEICKVNPTAFRDLKFSVIVSPDVMNPMSDTLEKAFNLELYDRAIVNGNLDQEIVTKELLLGAFPRTKDDPDHFMAKQIPGGAPMGAPGAGGKPNSAADILKSVQETSGQGVPPPPRAIPSVQR